MAKATRPSKKPAVYDPGLSTADNLAEIKANLERDLGGKIFFGRDSELDVRYLPTGLPALDRFLGGGFAHSRMTLLYGQFSAGKSVIAALAARAGQGANLTVAWIDAEKAWNPEWAEALGLNPAKMIVTQPSTGEEAFEQAFAMLKAKVGVVVFDSLMAMRTKSEFADEPGENVMSRSNMGAHAKMIGKGLMDCIALNEGTILVAINQVRDKVGMVYGNPEVIPGGRGQHFVASQEIKVSRGEWLEEGTGKAKKRLGYRMKLRMEKNKLGAPFEEVELPFYFTGRFDEVSGLISLAKELGVITLKGPMYTFGEQKFFGLGKLEEALRESDELREAVDYAVTHAADDLEEVDL